MRGEEWVWPRRNMFAFGGNWWERDGEEWVYGCVEEDGVVEECRPGLEVLS